MRRFTRTPAISQQFARNSVPEYRPQKNDQKYRNWSSRINNLSTLPASRGYLSQLQALLSYYNRQVADTTKVINYFIQSIEWDNWNSKIITKGLVNKVKDNYTQLSAQEYDLDKIFTEIFSKDSKALDQIVFFIYKNRTTKWPSIQ